MTKNLISKMIDYFYGHAKFSDEIGRAMKEFMDIPADGVLLTFPKELAPHFTEWFVYDFKLTDGRTPLAYFYEVNPYKLSPWQRQEYKDLQDNEYGMYEVLKVDLDVGLEIKNLASGHKYYVYEHGATFELVKGSIFFTRAAKNGDHYELVGANSFIFPAKLGGGLRRNLEHEKRKLSPKDLRFLITGEEPSRPGETAVAKTGEATPENIQEIENRLNDCLAKYKLDKMVSAVKIEKWLAEENAAAGKTPNWEQRYTTAATLLFGLEDGRLKMEELNELLGLVTLLANYLPRAEFNGLSPAEKEKANEAENLTSSYRLDSHQIGSDWYQHFERGMNYFKDYKFASALKQYNEVFRKLLEGRTTMPEIYRIYANKAMAHFSLAQETEAVKMLEIALELNPNYDFANYQISKYRLGKLKEPLEATLLTQLAVKGKLSKEIGELKKIRKNLAVEAFRKLPSDPAVRYYEFIKPYGINFATDKPIKSKIFTAGDKVKVKKKINGE